MKTSIKILVLVWFTLMSISQIAAQKYSINISNGKTVINDGANNFKVEYRGDIKLSDNDEDIISLSRNGYFEVTKKGFGSRRRILIEPGANGSLVKTYYEGRSEKPWTPEGQKWLAEILQEVVQSTTINLENRVDRFYARGGTSKVLKEIAPIESDYVKEAYYDYLMQKNPPAADVPSILNQIGSEIESDHYATELLKKHHAAFLATDQSIAAYIKACRSIESDHYTSEVLKEVISNQSINVETVSTILNVSRDIGSDHYRSEVLRGVMRDRSLTNQQLAQVLSLSADMGSDHYKSEVLKEGLRQKSIDDLAFNQIVVNIASINSDHYFSDVVKSIPRSSLEGEKLGNLLTVAAREVESSHYLLEVLRTVDHVDMSADDLITYLDACRSIDSDHYKSEALKNIATQVNRSGEQAKNKYMDVARTINSEHYLGSAIKALN